MENQPTGDPIRAVTSGRRAVTPAVCVADAEQSMRTFLRATLEELGFVTCECVRAAELDAVLDSQPPDLVVIGSSAGGIDACQMVELLAAKEFDGKVVVFGPRVSPMVTAIQALGQKLGLAMLPLLPTPFSSGNVRDCVATLAPVEAASFAARDTREALHDDRGLELWYQPKIDLRTLALCRAEALLHAQRPDHGISPSEHFTSDEALSGFVIARAVNDWRYFVGEHGHIEIAINLPIAFFRKPEAVGSLCRQLPDHPAFEGLIIEINGFDAVRNLDLVKDVARRLRSRKVALSVGNLGAEWPTLLQLHDFPFVELKVDRRFVAGCSDNWPKQTICRRIIEFADAVGARTVAEGVECRADFLAAREMGFHLAQGSLFAKPMAARKFSRTVLGRPVTVTR
jgi:EAL domain-containing protein (putative c-di-GMP-specific phosphodiesterase class I)/CheY-like chemotaxis protein